MHLHSYITRLAASYSAHSYRLSAHWKGNSPCVHVCMYARMHVRMYVSYFVCVCVCACMCLWKCSLSNACIYSCMHVFMCLFMCMRMYMYVHMCGYTYHTHLYSYIHTCIHAHKCTYIHAPHGEENLMHTTVLQYWKTHKYTHPTYTATRDFSRPPERPTIRCAYPKSVRYQPQLPRHIRGSKQGLRIRLPQHMRTPLRGTSRRSTRLQRYMPTSNTIRRRLSLLKLQPLSRSTNPPRPFHSLRLLLLNTQKQRPLMFRATRPAARVCSSRRSLPEKFRDLSLMCLPG
jgi:hypothetical protein